MIVLHLGNPRNTSSWLLVARTHGLTRAAGHSLADLLALPIPGTRLAHNPVLDIPTACRQALAAQKVVRLGRVSNLDSPGAAESHFISVCPLGDHCVGVVFEDVSLLSRATRDLLEARSLLDQMCQTARVILFHAELDFSRITYLNPEAVQVLGYWIERWQHEANFCRNHTHPDDWPAAFEHASHVAMHGGERQFDCRMFAAGGQLLWFHFHLRRITLPNGRTQLAGTMIDITDRKRVEQAARDLSLRVMRSHDEERRQISGDLHERIGQHLAGVHYAIENLQRNLRGSSAKQRLSDCTEALRACLTEIQAVTDSLHPPVVDILGLAPALRQHAAEFAERTGIPVELDLPENMQRLSEAAEITLFRLTQECLRNVLQHARSNQVRVRLRSEKGAVRVEIEDNGVGVQPGLFERLERGASAGGIGLLKMREQIHQLQGTLEIVSHGKGTRVRASIPGQAAVAGERRGRKLALVTPAASSISGRPA